MLEYINQLKDIVVGKIMISLGEGIRLKAKIKGGLTVKVRYNGDFSNTPEGLRNRAGWDEDEIRKAYKWMGFRVGHDYELRGVNLLHREEDKKWKAWVLIGHHGERLEGEKVQLLIPMDEKKSFVVHSFLFDAA